MLSLSKISEGFYKVFPILWSESFSMIFISARYQFGLMLEIFLVNFQRSITVLILFGSPSNILLFLSFLTEIISLTNFTVKKSAPAVFSKFSIAEDLIL